EIRATPRQRTPLAQLLRLLQATSREVSVEAALSLASPRMPGVCGRPSHRHADARYPIRGYNPNALRVHAAAASCKRTRPTCPSRHRWLREESQGGREVRGRHLPTDRRDTEFVGAFFWSKDAPHRSPSSVLGTSSPLLPRQGDPRPDD